MIDEISESRRVTHLFMQSELKSLKIYHRVSRCWEGIEKRIRVDFKFNLLLCRQKNDILILTWITSLIVTIKSIYKAWFMKVVWSNIYSECSFVLILTEYSIFMSHIYLSCDAAARFFVWEKNLVLFLRIKFVSLKRFNVRRFYAYK